MLAAAAAAAAALAVPAAVAPDANNALGPLYPVAEESLLAVIRDAAARYEGSGRAGADRVAMRARAEAYVAAPPVQQPIRHAGSREVRMFDPTVTLHSPVRDASGRLLHPAGTRINPLDHGGLDARLVLFDGRDARQRAFAREQARLSATVTHPILVAGSPAAFSRATGLRAYFDQHGTISRRLQIDSYPAVVTRQGSLLRIETGIAPAAGK